MVDKMSFVTTVSRKTYTKTTRNSKMTIGNVHNKLCPVQTKQDAIIAVSKYIWHV